MLSLKPPVYVWCDVSAGITLLSPTLLVYFRKLVSIAAMLPSFFTYSMFKKLKVLYSENIYLQKFPYDVIMAETVHSVSHL